MGGREPIGFAYGAWWQLENHSTGATVREILGAPLAKLGLWSAPTVVASEMFAPLAVAPGQSVWWWREYTFEAPR